MPDLISELYAQWCNMSCTCNNGYVNWQGTWCTYGQCSNLTQHNYFQTALNITALANLLEVFEVNGIVPSSSTSYNLRDIETALMANLGLSTHIECIKKGGLLGEATLLSKINICVSPNGQSIVGCPFTIPATCNSDVWFYPFPSNELPGCEEGAAGSGGLIEMVTEKYLAM